MTEDLKLIIPRENIFCLPSPKSEKYTEQLKQLLDNLTKRDPVIMTNNFDDDDSKREDKYSFFFPIVPSSKSFYELEKYVEANFEKMKLFIEELESYQGNNYEE